MTDSMMDRYVREVQLRRDKVESFEAYPFSLPVVRHLDALELHTAVAFLIGENGSGKWMVNSTKDYETYNPLGKQESDRCVSVVNGTAAERPEPRWRSRMTLRIATLSTPLRNN